MARGKRYREAYEKIDRTRAYPPAEAIHLIKETAGANFDETVELHIRLGVNVRHAEEQLRGTLALPKGLGKNVTIAVFAEGDPARQANEAGADFVGSDDLAERVEGGWTDFDVAIAHPSQMPKVGKLGRVLGPQGKMPNPKVGTVTEDIAKAVEEAKAGKVEYRTDRQAIVHLAIGKTSFSETDLLENYAAVIEEIIRAKPAAAKGRYILSITVTTTMGPGIRVDPSRTRRGEIMLGAGAAASEDGEGDASRPPSLRRPRRRRRRRPAEDRHPLHSSLPTAAPDRRRDQVQKSGAGERESHRSSRPPTLARLRAGLFFGGAGPERNGQRAEDSSGRAARRGAQGRPGDLRGGLPWHQRAAGRRAARRSARRRYPLPRRQESSHPARRRRRRDRHAQGAPERADRPGTRQGRRRPGGQDDSAASAPSGSCSTTRAA